MQVRQVGAGKQQLHSQGRKGVKAHLKRPSIRRAGQVLDRRISLDQGSLLITE